MRPADLGDLLTVCVNTAVEYSLCAARHAELSGWATGD